MNHYRDHLLKGLIALAAIIIIFTCISRLFQAGSDTLSDYAEKNPEQAYSTSSPSETGIKPPEDAYNIETTGEPMGNPQTSEVPSEPTVTQTPSPEPTEDPQAMLLKQFYYAPLTEEQKEYITGCSYPDTEETLQISYDDLSYVHILHYNFEGDTMEGELICNNAIAADLLEIFYELYLNEYQQYHKQYHL